MNDPAFVFGALSYTISGIIFAALAGILAIGWQGRLQGTLLIIACLASAAWTGVTAYAYWTEWSTPQAALVLIVLELMRDVVWIVVLWSMLARGDLHTTWFWRPKVILPVAMLGFVLAGVVEVAFGLGTAVEIPKIVLVISLALAVTGVVLTETLYRNGSEDERWYNKFLCLGVGGFFAFNMFVNADAILLNRIDPSLVHAKGAVQVLLTPLLAVAFWRNKLWRSDLTLSRDVVLHSTTFIFGGLYLFLMAIVGYYIRGLGAEWGSVAQITFLFGAVVLLVVVLFSGTSRAYLKVFFSKHFFKERYDYRDEWHRFIQTLSEGLESTTLEERAILAVAEIVESPGGAIWLIDGDRFAPAGSRNLAIDDFEEPLAGSLAKFLSDTQWVIVVEEAVANPDAYADLDLPHALRKAHRAWAIVPLWHRSLVGFMVLAEPRAPRTLLWEDFDLLKTVGRQIASYLAEQRADRALTEAREFEEFNRRYAFVIHDIKNIVSQLSLVAANFRKHSGNPEFLEDMIETVDEAVGKMNRITDKINARQVTPGSESIVALTPLLRRVGETKKAPGTTFHTDFAQDGLSVVGDADRLEAVVGHLVQNAIEATEHKGCIRLSLHKENNFAVISITDNGPGMDPEFINKELFKPFRSTKGRGFGIGAYQCRAYAHELGGRLDVESAPGKGTTMRMHLPLNNVDTAETSVMVTAESSQ